jgi:hypothetical protein
MSAIALFAVTASYAPAPAQSPVVVPRFDSVELNGGGTVTIRHGATQRVTLLRGDLSTSEFTVDRNGTLEIRSCRESCRNYRLEVEIVTPEIEAVAINGGGHFAAEGDFPARDDLAIAINGGGSINMQAVPSNDVAAAIRGGGVISANARRSLAASIQGGGAIRYLGDPSVSSSIRGGGVVEPVD